MLLTFPHIDSLVLALRSGAVPPQVAAAPAQASLLPLGEIQIVPADGIGRDESAQLQRLGVDVRPRASKLSGPAISAVCWAQLVPLVRDRRAAEVHDRLPVIFWLSDPSQLGPLVQEILRQGNDRLALRTFTDAQGREQNLLRVVGPPYYSLLQAIEARNDAPVRAFVERNPRVWIELGYAHPLASELVPAPGQWLFLSPSQTWTAVAEGAFRDLYAALDLVVPAQPASLRETSPPRITVPLKLVRGGSHETPELWVLKRSALEQLDRFVQSAADQTLARLAYAVVERSDGPWVLVRTRPGKGPPPELVFEGIACRSYLRIPNLLVPVGERLHPPLRREALKDLLAPESDEIVWLEGTGDDGRFTPYQLPSTAFRPLAEWVDYVLDREREPLIAWSRSVTFDFEPFVCGDAGPKYPPRKETSERGAPSPATAPAQKAKASEPAAEKKEPSPQPLRRVAALRSSRTEHTPSQLEQRLRKLEKEFLALEGPPDDPARTALWFELAIANTLLCRHGDAAQCFAHALWEESDSLAAGEEWLSAECAAAHADWAANLQQHESKLAAGALAKLIATERPQAQHVQLLAAWLVTATALDVRLTPAQQVGVQQFLEQTEAICSVRVGWLAWHALYRLSGDELMLARARDRLLQRLHEYGLKSDLELPLFLRAADGQSDRFRQIHEEIAALHARVHEWSDRNRGQSSRLTHEYIDLMFAYAYARLGESNQAQQLASKASGALTESRDPVHRWLSTAFEYRILQLIEGRPATGQLPERFLEDLAAVDSMSRYKADRLRQYSSILEPHDKLNAYRHIYFRHRAGIANELGMLFDLTDRGVLEAKLRELAGRKLDPRDRALVLTTALELAWRIGEAFAKERLAEVDAKFVTSIEPEHQLKLVSKGVLAAGHFDQHAYLPKLLAHLHRLLASLELSKGVLEALEEALAHSFRGLRKLGMRSELAELLEEASRNLRQNIDKGGADSPEQMRVLLVLSGTSLYLGNDDAWSDIDRARDKLLSGDFSVHGHIGERFQGLLAANYVRAVGQAPLAQALERLRDFFEHSGGIYDNSAVNSHYNLKQLMVVEALVETLVSDSFTMDRSTRMWLDDEEFIIRRRIHRDVRAALEEHRK